KRALSALFKAYVDPAGLFDLVESAPLVPNLPAIAALVKDDTMPGAVTDDAVKLIRVIGPPQCVAPLVAMIGEPHPNPRIKFQGADSALKCGGIKAIKDVVHALPDAPYDQTELEGAVVVNIVAMSPRAEVITNLRDLLAEKGRMSRWVAIE